MKKLLFIVSFFCLSFDAAAFYSGLNFVPDSEYESLPKAELYRAYLPPRVDLSSQMPPVGSQGTVGACVGWSLVYSIRSYYAQTSFSPSFMYDNLVEGDCNKGLSFPLALSFLRDVGAVRISDYPIKVDNCSPNSNSSLLVPSAVNFKIKNWKTIKPSQIESIKGSLYRGNPVAVGMIIGSDFHLYTGGIYKNTQVSEPSGGHAMVIVGYDDRIKAFKLMNSWGPTWGEDGFGWISYDVLKSKAKELYIIGTDNLVPQPKPQPKPQPQPQPQPQPKPQHVEKIVTQQDVDDLIYEINNSVECSKIIGQLTGKKLTLDGVVQKTDDLEVIERRINEQFKEINITNHIKIRAWPTCEALITLSDMSKGIKSEVKFQPSKNIYKVGEILKGTINVPNKGFLSVFYLQANGTAVPIVLEKKISQQNKINIDSLNPEFILKISPPVGSEAIIMVLTKKQNVMNEISKIVSDREFLSNIRGILQEAKNDNILESIGITYLRTEQ